MKQSAEKRQFLEKMMEFRDACAAAGIPADEDFYRKVGGYSVLLQEWIPAVNLISRSDAERFLNRHVLESAAVSLIPGYNPSMRLLDFGTGGGFPGLILKLLFPPQEVLLVDSVRKKTLFLQKCIDDLDLNNIAVLCERIEKVPDMYPQTGTFSLITSRAVGSIEKVLSYVEPLFSDDPAGRIIIPRGPDYREEADKFGDPAWKLEMKIIPLTKKRSVPFAVIKRSR